MIRPSRWVLAIAATGTASCLSVLAGWQRGGSLPERLVWVAIGVVLVVSAHLLPALVRDSPYWVRAAAGVLWLACMATACYGHATFFLQAQRHAGELRASAIPMVEAVPAGRSLTAVMAERAEVTARLAMVNAQYCPSHCPTLEARRIALTAKLDALDAEAGEIRSRQSANDRAVEQRDVVAADPVTARLAALLGMTVARIDVLSGLTFAAVLEGVACLLWTIALQPQPAPRITAVAPSVIASHGADGGHTTDSDPVIPLPVQKPANPDVTQLARDIAAGRVRPTVADIRRHLSCSQARAAALRRQLVTLTPTA